MNETNLLKQPSDNPMNMSNIFAFARWIAKYDWKIDSEDGCWFREYEDELTPDISVEYTDIRLWEMFLKHCS